MTTVRMIHIGKTGGSSLKMMFKSKRTDLESKDYNVRGRKHAVTMKQLKRRGYNHLVVFVRHPIGRFVSAFNSRLRQGQPRFYSPWTQLEEIAFSRYNEANELGEALSSDNPDALLAAKLSMHSINHVKDHMSKWLSSIEFLEDSRNILYYIGVTETMDEDVIKLFQKMGVTPPDTNLDEVARHETPPGFSKTLSPRATDNLVRWYAKDIQLYEWCLANRGAINAVA